MASVTTKPNPSLEPLPFANRIVPVNSTTEDFDAARGEIIFPSTEPFRLQIRQTLGADAEPFVLDAIYNSTREDARRDTKVSKYTISGDIAGSGGNKISLGAFNLAPNSIKVTSNGEPLGTAATLAAAQQEVFHDPERPSALLLPILRPR